MSQQPSKKEVLLELHTKLNVPAGRVDPAELDAYDALSDDGEDFACRVVGYWYDIERDRRRVELDSGWVVIFEYTEEDAQMPQGPSGSAELWRCMFIVGVTGHEAKTVDCGVYILPPQ